MEEITNLSEAPKSKRLAHHDGRWMGCFRPSHPSTRPFGVYRFFTPEVSRMCWVLWSPSVVVGTSLRQRWCCTHVRFDAPGGGAPLPPPDELLQSVKVIVNVNVIVNPEKYGQLETGNADKVVELLLPTLQ